MCVFGSKLRIYCCKWNKTNPIHAHWDFVSSNGRGRMAKFIKQESTIWVCALIYHISNRKAKSFVFVCIKITYIMHQLYIKTSDTTYFFDDSFFFFGATDVHGEHWIIYMKVTVNIPAVWHLDHNSINREEAGLSTKRLAKQLIDHYFDIWSFT